MTQQNLDLDALFRDIREELHDMGNFLDVEAMRRQNEPWCGSPWSPPSG